MRYRNIFFDLDGTLTDSAEGITNSVMHALAKQGVSVTDRRSLYRFIGPPLIDSFEQFYGFTHEQALKGLADYREYFATKGIFENKLMEGCIEMLDALKSKGCHLYVCTSKPDQFTNTILSHFGIDGYFEGVFAASMDEKLCRKEDILRLGLTGIERKDECVMVGDRHHDIEGATVNGIDSIGVLCGFGNEKELSDAGATYIVNGLAEVANIVLAEEEMFEYELIDFCIEPEYEQAEENTDWKACEESQTDKPQSEIKYDADGVPMGDSPEEKLIRREMIHKFIQQWREQHSDNPCVFNENLQEYIRINQTFMIESVSHAVGNYKSTKAVLRMEEIMAKAEFIGESRKKEGDNNQKSFEKMIVMIYRSEELGNVKMTVGIRKFSHEKIEYSLTVPPPHTPFLDNSLKINGNSKKRKKRSK